MLDIAEQIENYFGTSKIEFEPTEDMFNRMANFIFDLEPDSLSDEQLEEVIDLISSIETKDEDETNESINEDKMAGKSSPSERQYARKYYRNNITKIKRKKVLFKRSSEGRKRKKLSRIMSNSHKTPTGRKKVKYRRILKRSTE